MAKVSSNSLRSKNAGKAAKIVSKPPSSWPKDTTPQEKTLKSGKKVKTVSKMTTVDLKDQSEESDLVTTEKKVAVVDSAPQLLEVRSQPEMHSSKVKESKPPIKPEVEPTVLSSEDKGLHYSRYFLGTATLESSFEPLEGHHTCDVCIIGGGVTGISAALYLIEKGLSVILLEADKIASQETGSSLGQLCTGFGADISDLLPKLGEEAIRDLFALSEDAKQLIVDNVHHYQINCDLNWGFIHAALNQHQMSYMSVMAGYWAKSFNYHQMHLLSQETMKDYVYSPQYAGGFFEEGAGTLHVVNYLHGLGAAALDQGVVFYEKSPVLEVKRGYKPLVKTEEGSVQCYHVVVAANSGVGSLLPELGRATVPAYAPAVVTPVLAPDVQERYFPRAVCVNDFRYQADQFQITNEGRLLFSSGLTYKPRGLVKSEAFLRKRIEKLFPGALEGHADFDYVWEAPACLTASRFPKIGVVNNNIYYATGFSGQGLLLGGLAAFLFAESIEGKTKPLELMASIPCKPMARNRTVRSWFQGMEFLKDRIQDRW